MSDQMQQTTDTPGFITRVISNDATKKGAAAALAGILVAVVSEALWPSGSSS